MNSKQRLRARFVLVILCLAACVLAASLYWTEIVKGSFYSAKAKDQYVKPTVSLFDRGSIFFETKDGTKVTAATLDSGYLVYMNPSQISDAGSAYQAVSEYLKLDRAQFTLKAGKDRDVYEELAHRVPTDTASVISGLHISGIGIAKEAWRSYSSGGLAANALGIIGESPDGSVEGRYGLERSYEDVLSRPGIGTVTSLFAELFSGLRDSVGGREKEGDIVTTLEPTVEGYLEKILYDTDQEWHPDEIGGIIIDPRTGEIMAMASMPTFDPNDTSKVKNASVFSNPLVEHVDEMGSIMKPLTIAAGLDSGAITPNSTYDDTGTMTLNGKTIANFDGKARGIVDIQEILSQSLNIGAATVALKLDHEVGAGTLFKYFGAYGLDRKTGIDEPNEATGLVSNLKSGRDIEIATAAYGQGIAISPIEMARALSVLGNDGYLVVPHLVKEINYADGTTRTISPDKSGPVLKKRTVDDVTKMLVKVVDTALAKGAIKMDHYTIAAKTGTAQIPDHIHGGYYTDRYLHSFFGYFPAYDPKFLIFLYQIYPKGAKYASETLTRPFDELAKFLINYYNIAPDR